MELASNLYRKLQKRWNVIYDQSGAIGEGIEESTKPGSFGITVDFDTLEGDGSFTLRDRIHEQVRPEEELIEHMERQINP